MMLFAWFIPGLACVLVWLQLQRKINILRGELLTANMRSTDTIKVHDFQLARIDQLKKRNRELELRLRSQYNCRVWMRDTLQQILEEAPERLFETKWDEENPPSEVD